MMSTVCATRKMTNMEINLGTYIESRRRDLGLSQVALAERAEVPSTTVNRIERGVTKLPSADVRRRLARVLGVSHLDLLVAAGEITPEEINQAGATPVIEHDPSGPMARLAPLIEEVRWTDERLEAVEGDLRFYMDFDERKSRR